MKSLIIAATLAGLAVANPLAAQGRGNSGSIPPGQMPRAGMCRVWIDGVPPGRQPAQTDCATARAQATRNGGRVIYGSNSNNRQDCTYNQTTNSVGDIIFGRSGTNTTNCRDNRTNRVDGSWYQVGRDGNGNTIYERRVRDANGNVIIQRARRDSFGNMSIISSRNAGSNGTYNNGTYNNRRGDDGDDDDDQGSRVGNKGRSSRGSDDYNNDRSERNGKGRGKGHKGRD